MADWPGKPKRSNPQVPWWQYAPPGSGDFKPWTSASGIIQKAVFEGIPCYSNQWIGYTELPPLGLAELFAEVLGYKIMYYDMERRKYEDVILTHPDGIFNFSISPSGKTSSLLWTTNAAHHEQWCVLCEEHFSLEAKAGEIQAVIRSGPTKPLEMIPAGCVHSELEELNYDPKVIKGFEAVVEDLKSEHPKGRISIFDGPPGTGKTYLLRALIMKIPEAQFVLVPSELIKDIGGPEMMSLLASSRRRPRFMMYDDEDIMEEEAPKKVILLVEDADDMLAPRKAKNMATISSALNIGDGIMGEVFKLSIICTTNTPVTQIDPALKRPGRLSQLVHVGSLDVKQAKEIYKRLMPKGRRPAWRTSKTLAEIYAYAREKGWKPE